MEAEDDQIAGRDAPVGSPRRSLLRRYWPLLLLIVVAIGLWLGGAERYFDRQALIAHALTLKRLVHQHPVLALDGFVAAFAVTTATGLPDVTMMTLASGYLFGPWVGGVAADIGATAGAVLVYAALRSSVGAALRERAERSGGRLKAVLDGVQAGAFGYMLTARMLPASPFWLVSVAASIAGTPFRSYVLGTFLGVLPALFVYAGLGSGLGSLIARGEFPHMHELLSPDVTIPLAALGLLSLGATAYVHRRAIAKWLGLRSA
jgi:uncharacterized membrane protein YdjX (TVP38/TMEM64 family)